MTQIQLGEHRCHAEACTTPVPPKMFMCRKHWYMVSPDDRRLLWHLYMPGQEIHKDPTQAYLEHAQACIDVVAAKEGRR